MGYQLSQMQAEQMFQKWSDLYEVFAPKRMEGEGCFSDTDIIRYGKITSLNEIEWDKKSDYSLDLFENHFCVAYIIAKSKYF